MPEIVNGNLTEDCYEIENEGRHAAVFTTGNGYMGVRGSFEEFGSVRVQGAYIRGFIGSITEVFEPLPDNAYMKNYYFDEDKLKVFEKQDSVINLSDFLLVRVYVDGQPFYPWQGKVLAWRRALNPATGVLEREVVWDNGKGDVTRFCFSRFASYADKHHYCLRAAITPENHSKPIRVISGIDTRVKTGGQKVTAELSRTIKQNVVLQHVKIDNSFGFEAGIGVRNDFYRDGKPMTAERYDQDGLAGNIVTYTGEESRTLCVEKTIVVRTSREDADGKAMMKAVEAGCRGGTDYAGQFAAHQAAYRALFDKFDIQIAGDEQADGLVRYANYQTLISADDDGVHSLAAKGLTGERYNNFVWWDCEIYQLPVFICTCPERAKEALLYRYRLLGQSKRNAEKEGYTGARYAFCSSVTGEEKVWIYARHPFLQIHINADIAYAVINYFRTTGDEAFLRTYGLEMLCEIARYWTKRCVFEDGKYQIKNVTGTDEHHPYVDNDAYTNYLVRFTVQKTLDYARRFLPDDAGYALSAQEIGQLTDIADKMYLPALANGLIPQFDGYFDLSRTLPLAGGSAAKRFQMKQSGLYHLSQVIKQPDVMLLFNYVYGDKAWFTDEQYRLNWDYYEKMCETASSLSFPAHAICAADNAQMLSFYDYLMQTVKIDIDDLHRCAWQGVHSACLAGAWLCIYRGVFGIDMLEEGIRLAPAAMPFWESVSLNFCYRGTRIRAKMRGRTVVLSKDDSGAIPLFFQGRTVSFTGNRVELPF